MSTNIIKVFTSSSRLLEEPVFVSGYRSREEKRAARCKTLRPRRETGNGKFDRHTRMHAHRGAVNIVRC